MPSFDLKSLTSAVTLSALLANTLAAPNILHAHAPLSEYDANIMARIDQHLGEYVTLQILTRRLTQLIS